MHVSIGLLPQMTPHLCLLILSGLAVSSQQGLEDVFFSPQEQTVKEGQGVFFQCVSGESSPAANISWLKDGKMVTRGRQIQGEYGGGHQKKTSGTLHLFNVTLEDDGVYVCVTHNPLLNISKNSKPAKLTVQGVPRRLQIIQGPDNITVATGTEAAMHCAVRGFPVPMVRWFKDGCLLTNCSASFSLQNNGQLLIFRNVTNEDEGSYHCEASNLKETIKSQAAFLLPAEMDWSFVQQPTNLTVRRGQNVTVTCRPPHSRPAAQVSWFKNNQLLLPTGHINVLPSGDLYFHSVQEYDSGSYFCRASNIHLQRFLTSRRATLTVLAPPSVELWPQVLTVPVGAQVVLECQVSGHPLPSMSWMKRGHSKQTGGKISMGQRNATLLIQSARSYDEGVYVCEASNSLGQSRRTALLRVAVSPIIVTFKGQVSCRIGASVLLPCKAVGIQPIIYTWTRGGTRTQSSIMSPTEHKYIDEDGALHISGLQHSDAGEYYCTAENRAGRHQRHLILTVTAEDHPADRGKQTRLVLSASNTADSVPVQHLKTTHHPHRETQDKDTTCSVSSGATTFPTAVAESKMPQWTLSPVLKQQLRYPPIYPTQLLVTQMQPPILPPPPHPKFQSIQLHTQMPVTITSTVTTEDLRAAFQHLYTEGLRRASAPEDLFNAHTVSPVSQITEMPESSSKLPVGGPLGVLKLDLYTQSHTAAPEAPQSQQPIPLFHPSFRNPSSTPQQSFTLSLLPKFHLELSTVKLHSSTTKPEPSHPSTATSQTQSESSSTEPPPLSFLTLRPPDPDSPTMDPKINQQNATHQDPPVQSAKSTNDTELTDSLKRNTSQSPMTSNDPRATQQSPSWLPVLEKHDIPIVVGVGVSLAFIFITVTFYSVVQKNEPAPTCRAAQRKLGVPIRHAERRATGRTYENRAFEDDDCVAVIEQSPNTSDTRARPPGPSLVTVQMEPTFEDLQEDNTSPTVDNHSVTVETYPEAIIDTKIDPCLEDEKGCSLSQPSIQLQCAEDWTSNRGDNHSPCQDALPPPSSLPSCSPSPSPPSRRDEGLHSSLTLHSSEPCLAPIHHSLSISHGSPPLLLSHHVSLGLTTVAVDVHFYPTATASMAAGTSTRINSVSNSTPVTAPLFSPPLVNSQESNQSAGRFHQSK